VFACKRQIHRRHLGSLLKRRIIKTISRTNQAPVKALRRHVAHARRHDAVATTAKIMETKMTNPLEPIRRHPDGSIDFDRYRADIRALRHQATQDASKLGAAMKLAAAIAVMLVAIAVAPSRQADDASCHVCAGSGRAPASISLTSSLSQRHDAAVVPQLY
jgi:hypothetical protein